ncbi:Phospholipid-transporting ATPase [Reticulomyxa filosa]|uniref:Phospholipid-transporting ATPase n=1 Tax=Reticulomyxa filosa TaxID=46433 RepID=X6PEY3_RETFI|nr:Phospholipid-transporting ATPase [Reticulomyxa filosa]|eukprot:ETO37055.1 Phospholipid-transporting ATPase [Reticulomyxa filosa]
MCNNDSQEDFFIVCVVDEKEIITTITNEKQTEEAPRKRLLYVGQSHVEDGHLKQPHLENEDGTIFCSNYISTTKYTVITFLPLNLFEQFQKKEGKGGEKKNITIFCLFAIQKNKIKYKEGGGGGNAYVGVYANLYFLIIACLSFSSLSPKNPVFSVAPLTFVLAVSAIKEAFEDYVRTKEIAFFLLLFICFALVCFTLHQSTMKNKYKYKIQMPDDKDNKKWVFKPIAWEVQVFESFALCVWVADKKKKKKKQPERMTPKSNKDIEVGDIVKVTKKERAFPADLLLLQSSTNQGLCNIETANLDGETNLKIKQAIGATYLIGYNNEHGEDYPSNPKLDFKLVSEVNIRWITLQNETYIKKIIIYIYV